MRTIQLAALGAALVVGLASTASAQDTSGARQGTPPQGGQQGQAHGNRKGKGEMEGYLFRGITLTSAQRTQIQQIDEKYRPQMKALHDKTQGAKGAGDMQAQRPDSATREQMRTLMQQRNSDVRAVLTPDQQKVFDQNLSEARTRMKSHADSVAKGAKKSGTYR